MAYVVPPSSVTGEVARIRELVAKYFTVYETRVTPHSLVLAVQVEPSTMDEKFDALRRELWPQNYIPSIRRETGETVVEVLRRPQRTPWKPYVNVLMLVLTALTCLFAGAFLWVSYEGGTALTASSLLWGGITFALPLMAILGFHELAHFLVARRHAVEASLPFFVPMPPPFVIFGTFGAFISLREPIPDRKTLVEIGASGPLAGFAIAVPVTLLGLYMTSAHAIHLPLTNCGPVFIGVPYGDLVLGSSVLYTLLSLFFPIGAAVNLSPIAIAGWVGLLVTAINLLPAGQLDGGHVFRALLGPRSVWVSWAAVGILFVLGIFYSGWWLFGFLVLFLGARHPPPLNDITPLDLKRQIVGLAAVAILIGGFVLVPISSPSGEFAVETEALHVYGNTSATTQGAVNFTLVNEDHATTAILSLPLIGHAFMLSATVEVLDQSSASAQAYLENLTWTLHAGSRTLPLATSGAGVFVMPWNSYLALNATGDGLGNTAVPVSLSFSAPLPATLSLTVTVSENCQGVQQLESGSPVSATFSYPSAST